MQESAPATSKEQGTGKTGRIVSFTGMLIFFVCFFLPHWQGCKGEQIRPVVATQMDPVFLITWGLPFLFAFLMAVIYCARWILRTERARRCLIVAGCLLSVAMLAAALVLSAAQTHEFLKPDVTLVGGIFPFLVFTWLLAASAGAACALAITSPRPKKLPGCVGLCGVCSLGYFLYYLLPGPERTYYGLWLSVAASALVAIGGIWEAIRVRGRIAPNPRSP